MEFFVHILIGGIATGAIYSLIAVGYSITFSTMRVLNFALGMWVMIGGMLTLTFHVMFGFNLLITLAAVIAIVEAFSFAMAAWRVYRPPRSLYRAV